MCTAPQGHDIYILTSFKAPASFNKGTNLPFECIAFVSAKHKFSHQLKHIIWLSRSYGPNYSDRRRLRLPTVIQTFNHRNTLQQDISAIRFIMEQEQNQNPSYRSQTTSTTKNKNTCRSRHGGTVIIQRILTITASNVLTSNEDIWYSALSCQLSKCSLDSTSITWTKPPCRINRIQNSAFHKLL